MSSSRKSKVVRVTGLPPGDMEDAQALLHSAIFDNLSVEEQTTNRFSVTVVPSCTTSEPTRVAIVDFTAGLPSFLAELARNPFKGWLLRLVDSGNTISFDVHFHGFTQLYPVDRLDTPCLDIIAITGFDGHAYGSWRGQGNVRQMWLQHWLSSDLSGCRTMIYGYKSKLTGGGNGTIEGYSIELMEYINSIRGTEEERKRPVVFIAHSLGGLILARTLVKARQATDDDQSAVAYLHRATYGIFFFAVPHRGLDVEDMKNILNAEGGQMMPLLEQIDINSRQLSSQLVDFIDAIGNRKIVSFYETDQSRRLQKNEMGEWKRTGELYTSLQMDSSVLHLPRQTETAIRVDADHSSIVKFVDRYTSKYTLVVDKLKAFERDAPGVIQARFNRLVVDSRWHVPFAQDLEFVERTDILDRINTMLRATQHSPRVALCGLGGVGKSQIAIEYAYRLRKQSSHVSILWVHASSPARFRASYQAIAKELSVPGSIDPQANYLDLVYRWLLNERSGEWLLILDNADDIDFVRVNHGNLHSQVYDFSIAQYLPQRTGCAVLITSRYQAAAYALASRSDLVIHITAMTDVEAKNLIDKKIPSHLGTADERYALARQLDHIPLAIAQAAAYIVKRQLMSIAKYLRLFASTETASVLMLTEEGGDLRRDPNVPNSVMRTWEISFVQARSQNALSVTLLSLMALLDRQGVPEFLLRQGHTEFNFNEAIEVLLGYAFVMTDQHGTTFSMHRLVQLATREWLKSIGDLSHQQEVALDVIDRNYPTGDYEDWQTCQTLEPHTTAALLDEYGSERLELALARLLTRRSFYLLGQGQFKSAEKLADHSMKKLARILGEEHPDTLTSMDNLAMTYSYQGRHDEAEQIQVLVLELQKRVLGEEHPDTLTSMDNLAMTYSYQGRHDEVEQIKVQELELMKRVLGEEHPDTLRSMNNLAITYSYQGRHDEAEQIKVQVLELMKRVLGEEHPDTLRSMNNLAMTYSYQGRHDEAEQIKVQVLELQKRVLGEEHPDTLTSMSNLALTLQYLERYVEATDMFQGALLAHEKVLGLDHPNTLNSVWCLAFLYQKTKTSSESNALYERAVEGFEKRLGREHPTTQACREQFRTFTQRRTS